MFTFDTSRVMQQLLFFAVLLIFGAVFLALRNPDPFLNPTIYAEDGVWTGLGLTKGWHHALVYARPDYFVVGNVLLLWLAAGCSTALFGNPLVHLPESIAVVSCFFYSAVAVLTVWTYRNVMSLPIRVATYLLVLMLPLGVLQNEIIGRLLQIGFMMPYVATLLLYERSRKESAVARSLIDGVLFIAAFTNPVVIALAGAYLMGEVGRSAKRWQLAARQNISLAFLVGLSAMVVLPRLLSRPPGHLTDFNSAHLVEAVCARSLLYPFVFPWYEKMSDILAILLLALWLGVLVVAYRVSRNVDARRAMLFLTCGLVITLLATFVMRPGLTSLLREYTSSFPDRYFMGLNVFAVALSMLALSQIAALARRPVTFAGGTIFALILLYSVHFGMIFEFSGTKFPMDATATFEERARSVEIPRDAQSVRVPIAPECISITMRVPVRWLEDIRSRD